MLYGFPFCVNPLELFGEWAHVQIPQCKPLLLQNESIHQPPAAHSTSTNVSPNHSHLCHSSTGSDRQVSPWQLLPLLTLSSQPLAQCWGDTQGTAHTAYMHKGPWLVARELHYPVQQQTGTSLTPVSKNWLCVSLNKQHQEVILAPVLTVRWVCVVAKSERCLEEHKSQCQKNSRILFSRYSA